MPITRLTKGNTILLNVTHMPITRLTKSNTILLNETQSTKCNTHAYYTSY